MRYIDMLIQLELQNFDYLDSEIRSYERSLKKQKLFRSESIILNVIKLCNRNNNQIKKKKFFEQQIPLLQELKTDAYENQFLRSFDFIQWMKTKLTN